MRLKYIVEKKDKNNALNLREYMENDRDRFSLLRLKLSLTLPVLKCVRDYNII